MLKEEYIKPIPKKIITRIRNIDEKTRQGNYGHTTYYSYITKIKGDLAIITVACKMKNLQWFCKQVVIHTVHSDICLVRDIEYGLFGYNVGWYKQGLSNYKNTYDDNKWYEAEDKYYKVFCPIINKKDVLKFKQYKYSVANKYKYVDLIKYLRLYEEYPQIEYLMKLDLQQFTTNKSIIKTIAKDKNFRKWIIKNKEILQNKYGQYSYVSSKVILEAYKKDISIFRAQYLERKCKEILDDYSYRTTIYDIIPKKDIISLVEYIDKQEIKCDIYADYISACKKLNIDLSLIKNKFPKNFKKWHDIRIDQYNAKKALEDEKKRKQLYNQFRQIANKYSSMQRDLEDNYCVVIAKSPADLIKEGETLHHCVGRMNYDQKFAREESLIFFVRNKDNPSIPFVTLEYSLNNHKILQCYSERNSKPDEDVLTFINKTWLPYANKQLKKLAI